eukprot:TRINITY_DN2649_c0_g2_i1.p1 TRINITY_DN2649_c0_g2~~TRINITY_DN2649_c0_g2_i1.p1  ORF type:complete len:723 (-),score=162.62 TRINITY_DN2649_c0_g2_i1:19-2187(-)
MLERKRCRSVCVSAYFAGARASTSTSKLLLLSRKRSIRRRCWAAASASVTIASAASSQSHKRKRSRASSSKGVVSLESQLPSFVSKKRKSQGDYRQSAKQKQQKVFVNGVNGHRHESQQTLVTVGNDNEPKERKKSKKNGNGAMADPASASPRALVSASLRVAVQAEAAEDDADADADASFLSFSNRKSTKSKVSLSNSFFFLDTCGEEVTSSCSSSRLLDSTETTATASATIKNKTTAITSVTTAPTTSTNIISTASPIPEAEEDDEVSPALTSLKQYMEGQGQGGLLGLSREEKQRRNAKAFFESKRYWFGKEPGENQPQLPKLKADLPTAETPHTTSQQVQQGKRVTDAQAQMNGALRTDDGYLTKLGAKHFCLVCCAHGHHAGECPERRCFICYQTGHNVKFCPYSQTRCERCGRKGHEATACIKPVLNDAFKQWAHADVRCIVCSELGHLTCQPDSKSSNALNDEDKGKSNTSAARGSAAEASERKAMRAAAALTGRSVSRPSFDSARAEAPRNTSGSGRRTVWLSDSPGNSDDDHGGVEDSVEAAWLEDVNISSGGKKGKKGKGKGKDVKGKGKEGKGGKGKSESSKGKEGKSKGRERKHVDSEDEDMQPKQKGRSKGKEQEMSSRLERSSKRSGRGSSDWGWLMAGEAGSDDELAEDLDIRAELKAKLAQQAGRSGHQRSKGDHPLKCSLRQRILDKRSKNDSEGRKNSERGRGC